MNKIYYFLYKTTNIINNKYYYGMHSTRKLDDGYLGSGKYLRNSINKYGVENFTIEILEFFNTREEMCDAESKLITESVIIDEMCMNIRLGGFGGFSIDEQKLNAIKSNTKQILLREDKDWIKRKSERLSISNKKVYSDGRRERVYFYNWNGKEHNEEAKRKIGDKNSISQKGDKNSQFGTCWITKDNENKKIKKEELINYTNDGWVKGRKLN